MGIKINMSGAKIGGNADIMNGASVIGNMGTKIDMSNAEIKGNICALNNVQIYTIMKELEEQMPFMDRSTTEYAEIQNILNEDHGNQKKLSEHIAEHVGNFTTGVLANIVSGFLVK